MYFNEKEETNIDHQFQKERNFSLKNVKPIYWIISGIILLIAIIVIVVVILLNRGNKYNIELIGDERIIVTVGSTYIEPGYNAYDRKNNDVSSLVKITSNVDTSKIGEYEVVYTIDGITKVRYVVVNEGSTYIHLLGDINMYLKVGQKYVEPGYQVYDSADQNLTEKVKVSGKVDTSMAGTYQISYSVVNSRNQTITEKRTVIVTAK